MSLYRDGILQSSSLSTIRGRDDDEHPESVTPPSRHIANLTEGRYPYLQEQPDSEQEILWISLTEKVPVNRDDDGCDNTDLTYPNTLLLQIARIKKRRDANKGQFDTSDQMALTRIASSFR